jgi:hypothetical protein
MLAIRDKSAKPHALLVILRQSKERAGRGQRTALLARAWQVEPTRIGPGDERMLEGESGTSFSPSLIGHSIGDRRLGRHIRLEIDRHGFRVAINRQVCVRWLPTCSGSRPVAFRIMAQMLGAA